MGVAARITRHPEFTKEKVEPTTSSFD